MAKGTKQARSNKTLRPATRRSAEAGEADWPRWWLAAAVLVIAVCIVYRPALDAPFIFDDDISIFKNSSIQRLWPPIGTAELRGPLNPEPDLPTSARPIVNVTLAVNYFFSQLQPKGYHLFNLLVHCGSSVLLWAIVRRTLRLPYFRDRFTNSAGWLALAVALLWALHPLQTEAVIYITQRTELMMGFFYLATLYCSLRYWEAYRPLASTSQLDSTAAAESRISPRAFWLTMAVITCAAGMASKEVMISAPLIVGLFERTFVAGSIKEALRRSWPLYAGLVSTWVLLFLLDPVHARTQSAGFHVEVSEYSWWLTQCKVLLMYLRLVVWPWPLLLHYELPYFHSFGDAWMYVVPVFVLGVATLVLLWRNHPLGWLGTCFFAVLSPTLVVPITTEMAAERRMYVPLAALVALFVVGGYMLARRLSQRQAGAREANMPSKVPLATFGTCVVVLAVAYAVLSAKRANAYHSPMAIWQDILRVQPANYIAHQNIGYYYGNSQRYPEAIRHYREAIRLAPFAIQARVSLSTALLASGEADEAIAQLQEAVQRVPNDAGMRNNLATALFMTKRYDEAMAAYRDTLKLDPNNTTILKNYGLALRETGKYEEALASFEAALRISPEAHGLYLNIANCHELMGQRAKAIETLERGRKLAQVAGDTQNAERLSARLNELRPSRGP